MRCLAAIPFFAVLTSVPAAAQGGRFSFELAGGRSGNSPIFEQEVPQDALHSATTTTRLSVDDASTVSGRLSYRVSDAWTLVGELGRGSTGYYYSKFVTGSGGFVGYAEERRGTARRTAFSLGLAYRRALGVLPISIEPELSFAMQRFRVGNPGGCVTLPPSLGEPDVCYPAERWELMYSVPSVGAGVALGYAIVSRVAVELRGQYSVGRTSTKEGFYVDLAPFFDYAEAPKTQLIRSSHLSAGFRITP